jgi:uncharacterized protein with von Willebrand factor type A (vWA) domain
MGNINFSDEKNVRKVNSFSDLDENNEVKKEAKIKSDVLDLVFLLDKSGSMYGAVSDTIGGFNTFIQRERAKNLDTRVTLVLFDHHYKILYTRKPIDEVEMLTSDVYYADGCTALLDAIGTTINRLDKEISNKVVFVITTDGLENSSKEYTKRDIRNLISSHNWEFLFIGADIDSYHEAASIGIPKYRTANYEKSSAGLGYLFKSVSRASSRTRSGGGLEDGEWKKDLE